MGSHSFKMLRHIITFVFLALFSPAQSLNNRWTQVNGMRWGHGYNNPFNFLARLPNLYRVNTPASRSSWESLWGGLPFYTGEIPSQELKVEFPFGYTVKTNDSTSLGLVTNRPRLSWPADPTALYTVMLVDSEIECILPQQYIFWMVTNIPGSNVDLGTEVMDYVPPFSAELEDGKCQLDSTDGTIKLGAPGHTMLLMVYQQQGKISVEETRRGCSPELLTSIGNNEELARKYNLQLAAGNFFKVPYSGKSTDEMFCRFSKCTGESVPFLIPGLNDKKECQPRVDVMDVTLRGPVRGMEVTYNKYVSLYSPDSFINLIRSTYPVISTGVIREFRAVEGEFRDGKSLAETLEGDVNIAMLVYQSADAAIQLFSSDSPRARKILGQVLPALSTNGDYKVLLVQPDDQDFDVNIVARQPENLIDVEMVKVKPGQEEKFKRLRKDYKTRARSTRNIIDVVTFKAVQNVLETLPEDNLFNFPASNNEFMMTFYRNSEERQRALSENLKDPEYDSTFDCIACTVINTDLDPAYYPPFPADEAFPAFP